MAKRIIDGDALWASVKIAGVEEKYRMAYGWILPLSEVNGCFPCAPLHVWRTCFALPLPSWKLEDVSEMLAAYEKARMLFRFKHEGQQYGFMVGIEKRLPSPSTLERYSESARTPIIPAKKLAKFLNLSLEKCLTDYKRVLAPETKVKGTRGIKGKLLKQRSSGDQAEVKEIGSGLVWAGMDEEGKGIQPTQSNTQKEQKRTSVEVNESLSRCASRDSIASSVPDIEDDV